MRTKRGAMDASFTSTLTSMETYRTKCLKTGCPYDLNEKIEDTVRSKWIGKNNFYFIKSFSVI